jgi:hypothetical protein
MKWFRSRNREYCRRDPSLWPLSNLYPQSLTLTLPTSGGGIVPSRTQATEFIYIYIYINFYNDCFKHSIFTGVIKTHRQWGTTDPVEDYVASIIACLASFSPLHIIGRRVITLRPFICNGEKETKHSIILDNVTARIAEFLTLIHKPRSLSCICFVSLTRIVEENFRLKILAA